MKKIIALIIVTALFITGCAQGKAPQKQPDTSKPAGQSNSTTDVQDKENPKNDESNNQGNKEITKVKIFLIAIDDNGKSGKKIDTGDSIIPVEVTVEPTTAPLRAALNKLLSIKDREYGQSGLYNPLYQSDLKLENVTIKDGEAEINLSGNLKLGGILDNPRVKAQLEETARQFNTVKKAIIYLNGKKIDEALSEK